MTFNPRTWFPIAVVLSAVNVIAVWFAAVPAEPLHATIHAALAVAFGLWAQRLRRGSAGGEVETGLDALQLEVNALRQELGEAQERIDFAERVLAQESQVRRPNQEP
jgi:nitrogen fixation/metabolism regulation signal transduction histidine kinase